MDSDHDNHPGPGHDGALDTLVHLDTWNKMIIIAGAVASLVIVIFLIVCCVGDGCLIHDIIARNKRK